jgi:creatinine amidohydrolase
LADTTPERLAPCEHLLVLPLGATEQHGAHLPLDTDTVIAAALAEELARRRPVVVAPALAFGASGEHAGFSGTLSIGAAVLEEAIVELVRGADEWAGVVLVNWHGGNAEALGAAVRRLSGEGRRAIPGPDLATTGGALPCTPDAHAGRTETSLMLALEPTRVRLDRARAGPTRPLAELMPTLRARGVRAVSPSGVLGDPGGASAEEGRAVLAALVEDLCARVDAAAGTARPAP